MPANDIVDPDFDADDPGQRAELHRLDGSVLAAIALGGVIGAEARYGIGELLRHRPDEFSWATVIINASGCLLIGVLMAWIAGQPHPPRLARPFAGVGILGGYTTYSTFAVDTVQLLDAHRPVVAAAYVGVTVVTALLAAWAGGTLARRRWAPT